MAGDEYGIATSMLTATDAKTTSIGKAFSFGASAFDGKAKETFKKFPGGLGTSKAGGAKAKAMSQAGLTEYGNMSKEAQIEASIGTRDYNPLDILHAQLGTKTHHKYSRPRYGTSIKPDQDIAIIFKRDLYGTSKAERQVVTRAFSVQSVSFQRNDLHQVFTTFPQNVFAEFRGQGPIMVSFQCKILNTQHFKWEQIWAQLREYGGDLNPTTLAEGGKILDLQVDGMVFTGYIIGDTEQKTIELEAGPSLNFSFMALKLTPVPERVLDPYDWAAAGITEAAYIDADFRKFLTVYPSIKQIKGPDRKGFWGRFFDGVLKHVADPRKGMALAKAIISGDSKAAANILKDTGIGALDAGLVSGAQGTSSERLVNNLSNQGMITQGTSQMCNGNWEGLGQTSMRGIDTSVRSSTNKDVRNWGGAATGLGVYSKAYYGGGVQSTTGYGKGSAGAPSGSAIPQTWSP